MFFFRKAGITHHDIKDENVLINRKTLECKIIDFGCARPYNTSMVSFMANIFSAPTHFWVFTFITKSKIQF